MALNPFEQLKLFVSEPRQAFEDLVTMLLQDCGLTDGRVAIFCGDGGIDAYKGSFDKGGGLTVYQSKYFTEQWEETQYKQIRESFTRASRGDDFTLQRWFLCIPVRPTRRDLRWFDNWKAKQSTGIEIDLLDGDDLTKMLETGDGARTRQRFRDWGVFTVRGGSPVLQASVFCTKADTATVHISRLTVSIENRGDRTAEAIRCKITHSDTLGVFGQYNQSFWDNLDDGKMNPRLLQAKYELHAGEAIDVLQIPLATNTPFPFQISVQCWLRDQGSTRQFLQIESQEIVDSAILVLKPGESAISPSADGEFARKVLAWPAEDLWAETLLMDIANHNNPRDFGIDYFGRDGVDPTRGLYLPQMTQSGMYTNIDGPTLEAALEALVGAGWLDPGQPTGKATRYRLSDAARANTIFLYHVEQLKQQRESGAF